MQHILNTAHTVGCAVDLASALTSATILADAAVAPTISEMTYNVSSGTLHHTQPNLKEQVPLNWTPFYGTLELNIYYLLVIQLYCGSV